MTRRYASRIPPVDRTPVTPERPRRSITLAADEQLRSVGWVTAAHRRHAALLACDYALGEADPQEAARDLLGALGLLDDTVRR